MKVEYNHLIIWFMSLGIICSFSGLTEIGKFAVGGAAVIVLLFIWENEVPL